MNDKRKCEKWSPNLTALLIKIDPTLWLELTCKSVSTAAKNFILFVFNIFNIINLTVSNDYYATINYIHAGEAAGSS